MLCSGEFGCCLAAPIDAQHPPELPTMPAVQGLQGYNLFGGGGDGLGLGLDVQQLAAAQVSCAVMVEDPDHIHQ